MGIMTKNDITKISLNWVIKENYKKLPTIAFYKIASGLGFWIYVDPSLITYPTSTSLAYNSAVGRDGQVYVVVQM